MIDLGLDKTGKIFHSDKNPYSVFIEEISHLNKKINI